MPEASPNSLHPKSLQGFGAAPACSQPLAPSRAAPSFGHRQSPAAKVQVLERQPGITPGCRSGVCGLGCSTQAPSLTTSAPAPHLGCVWKRGREGAGTDLEANRCHAPFLWARADLISPQACPALRGVTPGVAGYSGVPPPRGPAAGAQLEPSQGFAALNLPLPRAVWLCWRR